MSEDPLGLKPDINLYRYVGNKPLNYKDPFGEDAAAAGLAVVCVVGTAYLIGDVVFEKKATNACMKRNEGDKPTCKKLAEDRSFPEIVNYVQNEGR